MKKRVAIIGVILGVVIIVAVVLVCIVLPKLNKNEPTTTCDDPYCDFDAKPLIYLYPQTDTEVTVKLGYPELLTSTYPKYETEWKVLAKPTGELIDETGRSFYGLYWEGYSNFPKEFVDGFVVSREQTISFLEEKLVILGLNEREANEFIIFWLPKLEQNAYNLIRFESLEDINQQMPLEITPVPDTLIRILMRYKPLEGAIEIDEQELVAAPQRNGFVAVEWGGSLVEE